MPDITNWLGAGRLSPVSAEARAAAAWRRIQDRASSIVVVREGVAAGAQTVRIEYSNTQRNLIGAGEASELDLIVFGVRNHPDDDVADTSLMADDRFRHGGANYEIQDVMLLPGEVQARATRIS